MRTSYLRKQDDHNGSALLPFIVVIPFLILIATYFMNLTVASFKLARSDQMHTHAQFTTDAGIDYAMQQINEDGDWAGTGSEIEVHNDGQVKTTYQVTVVTNSPDSKTLTSIGRTYRPVTASTPERSVKIIVDLRAVTSGEYSVVSGVGGLFLSNSAKILGGDVFVNGEIGIKNSAQIGLTTNPVNVEVAHQTCPEGGGAGYPRLCDSGENGEPISIENEAHIYGDVKANNQINGAGMSNPGLTSSSGVTPRPLPSHDRDAQKAAAINPMSGSDASCESNNGTRTWVANLKVTGDVKVSKDCKVTILGDVWITGKLELENSAEIIVSDSLGGSRPVIMVDGQTAKMKNSSKLVSNSTNTGLQLIAYWSKASCSPDCADVTGQDLYDSKGEATIELDNSAEGPQSIFYARWTRVLISNSGQIGALIGQTVELKNSGTITFGTKTGTGSTFWVIDGYRRSFN